MIDIAFLRHLRRMHLILDKKVTSNYAGERESLRVGHGIVFRDHRIYVQGDDYRDIDWKLFGRTDKLHVKRFEEESSAVVHILIDVSASMKFGERMTKYDYAAMVGIGFAYMALHRNEQFTLATFADKLDVFRPLKGSRQLVSIVEYARSKQPGGESKFEDSLLAYSKKIKHRSMIVVISDFLYDPGEVKRALQGFKDHEIVLVQVLDPREKELNLKGEFKFKDVETRGVLKTFVGPLLRKSYQHRLQEHIAQLNHISHQLGGKFFTCTTATDIFDTFAVILRQ